MTPDQALGLKLLLQEQDIAALGTLHRGEPFVSMVPYALLADGRLVIHVSQLATHTRDMQEHAGVSVMVLGTRPSDALPQEHPRASLQGAARACAQGAEDDPAARQA